jgi:phosphoribosyl-AMP cyclohydrolase
MIDKVKFDKNGLVTAIVQDWKNNDVLMVAYMNEEALKRTVNEGKMVYWSRSRQEYWLKGATSGNYQIVKEARIDCDGDALLFKVEQTGGACHEGYRSCFFRKLTGTEWVVDGGERLFDPQSVYKKK